MTNKYLILAIFLLLAFMAQIQGLSLQGSRRRFSKKTKAPAKPKKIGFASAMVVPDKILEQAPVGQFKVPTTNAPGLPFPDLSFKNLGDTSIIPGMTANVNGQVVGNIIKNGIMGQKHPTIWDSTHCTQVPFFPRNKPQPDCVTQSGWYMDMPTGTCKQTTVTCNNLATLNFFDSESLCKQMCTQGGQPIKVINTKVNLNPIQSCIQKPIIKMGTSKDMEVVWTYDAKYMTCWKIKVPVDSKTSANVYHDALAGAACQHMCHDVAPAGSGIGHSLQHSMGDDDGSMDSMMHQYFL